MGPVRLRDRATILGAHTPRAVELGAGASVASQSHDRQELEPYRLKAWSVAVPSAPGSSLDLQPDQTASLAPGGYTTVAVKSRSTLRLSAGSYFFKSLTLEPQAKLDMTQAGGPVHIYVLEAISYRGRITGGTSGSLLLAYLGTQAVNLEAPFAGTLVASKGKLSLSSVDPAAYQGAFFAKQLETQPGATVTLGPSLVNSLGTGDRAACMEGMQIPHSAQNSPAGRQAAYDALVNCIAPGIPECQGRITAAANVDRGAAAAQYMSKTFGSAQYLALARDRTRKVGRSRLDPALAAAYCAGDDDGDLVGTTIDACPATPPLTPTDDVGCPTTTQTVAPPRVIVDSLLASTGILRDPRCDGFGQPNTPVARPIGWTVNVGSTPEKLFVQLITGPLAPGGCDEFFELIIHDPAAPPERQVMKLTLRASEADQHNDGFTNWTIMSNEPGERGAIATFLSNYGNGNLLQHFVYVNVRVTTGSGQQSPWSGPIKVLAFTAKS
jgi:hypothetical protein